MYGAKGGGLASRRSPTGLWVLHTRGIRWICRQRRLFNLTPPLRQDVSLGKQPQPGERAKRCSPTTLSPIQRYEIISKPGSDRRPKA